MPMKVCLVSQEYPPETGWGGIATYTKVVAQGLAARGHTVDVISRSLTGLDYLYLDGGVRVHRLAQPPVPAIGGAVEHWLVALAWSNRVKEKVLEIAGMHGLDVVEVPEFDAEGLSLAGLNRDVPLVVRLHTPTFMTAKYNGRQLGPGDMVVDSFERTAVVAADLVTAPSRLVAGEAMRHWGLDRKVTVFANPVDTDQFRPRDCAKPRLTPYPTILFVGRLEPRKNPEALLRAVPMVISRFPRARFVFVGRDTLLPGTGESYFRKLQAMIDVLEISRANLRFVLGLPRDQVARHCQEADIVVVPSRFDNFPYAALEALACGTPVVVGSRTGLLEYGGAADGLFAVDPDDSEGLGRLLVRVLEDRPSLEELSGRARAAALERFGPDVIIPQVEKLYEGLRQGEDRKRAPTSDQPVSIWATDRKPQELAQRVNGKPRLGIVVLTHNAKEYTKLCIDSLLRWTDTEFELHIVDNASSDGTRDWLTSIEDRRVYVHLMDDNLGVPAGRNEGILGLNDTDYVVFLDNDVEVYDGWWQRMIQGFSDPLVGAVGHQGFRLVQLPDQRTLEPIRPSKPEPCDVLTGYALMVRRQVVEQVGLFDEGLGAYWFDDDDYCVRVLNRGYECVVVPHPRLLHFGSKSSGTSPDVMSAPKARANARYLYDKWSRAGMIGPDGRPRRPDPYWVEEGTPSITLPLKYDIAAGSRLRVLVIPPMGSLDAWVHALMALNRVMAGRKDVLLLLPLSDPFASREEMAKILTDALAERGIGESEGVEASVVDRWSRPSMVLAALRSCDLLVATGDADPMVQRYADQLHVPMKSVAELIMEGVPALARP